MSSETGGVVNVNSGPSIDGESLSTMCRTERSEEHTYELQSRSDLVCRLLLDKKKLQLPHLALDRHQIPGAPHLRRALQQAPLSRPYAHPGFRLSLPGDYPPYPQVPIHDSNLT